jgi:putative toxin-antitoxin system antitoxin component (TIGR02293 family)
MDAYQPAPAPAGSVLVDLGIRAGSARDLIAAVKRGLPTAAFSGLAAKLAVTEAALAEVTGISASTLLRRKRAGRLTPEESEHVLRIARLLDAAARVFGGGVEAAAWLRAPNLSLGEASPLAFADTEIGAREVEDLLGRIEYGVYS